MTAVYKSAPPWYEAPFGSLNILKIACMSGERNLFVPGSGFIFVIKFCHHKTAHSHPAISKRGISRHKFQGHTRHKSFTWQAFRFAKG